MALTDDITDPRLAKALAHPLRLEILRALGDRTASPSEIAEQVGAPLTNVSYHVRKLRSLGLIKLVRKTPKRGVIEHYYSAPSRPRVSGEAWAQTPTVVKQALGESTARTAASRMVEAAAAGGLDREDAHVSFTELRLDERGWKQAAKVVAKAQDELQKVEAQVAQRIADKDASTISAGATLALAELPAAESGDEKPPKGGGRRRKS